MGSIEWNREEITTNVNVDNQMDNYEIHDIVLHDEEVTSMVIKSGGFWTVDKKKPNWDLYLFS